MIKKEFKNMFIFKEWMFPFCRFNMKLTRIYKWEDPKNRK